MTEEQRELALALAPQKIPYFPGTRQKSFATDMAVMAASPGSTKKITQGQHRYLCLLAEKYRRHVPTHVLETAQRRLRAMEAGQA